MAKRILFCCDGTWDNSGKNTNVYKIYKAMQVSARQIPFYDDGVGADGTPFDRLLGGAFGTGLFQKVKDGYSKIAQVYEKGDNIFVFGFSQRRAEFPATLWTSPLTPGQVLEQVWFTGVHCDVGGSYQDDPDGTALADITLAWMMSKAAALGVAFAADVQAKYSVPVDAKCALDQKHESWTPLWALPKSRPIAANATLSNSVSVRCKHDASYRPRNLKFTDPDGQLSPQYAITETVGQPVASGGTTEAATGS
jgi:Uncharacterized alpha/beta hydrolase domain (DUF2235)